jgi:hypothetical protein
VLFCPNILRFKVKVVVLFTREIGKGLVVRPMKSFPFLEGFFDFILFLVFLKISRINPKTCGVVKIIHKY